MCRRIKHIKTFIYLSFLCLISLNSSFIKMQTEEKSILKLKRKEEKLTVKLKKI